MSPSPTRKRRRACESCHAIKARCEPNSTAPESPCQRCTRLGKECIPAISRRQKDRIADLEAQVAALTRALQAQNISKKQATSSDEKSGEGASPRRRSADSENIHLRERKPDQATREALVFLDDNVTLGLQQAALDLYVGQMVAILPIVPIQESDLTKLRSESPILLLCVIAFAAGGLLQDDVRFELIEKIMYIFAINLVAGGSRTLELIQSIQVAALWFRARPGFSHATLYQLVQLAAGEAIDLGIAGPRSLRSPAPLHGFNGVGDHTSSDARRIWLACFVVTSSLSVEMRRPNANTWNSYHEECLMHLCASSLAKETDRLLGQIVYAEKLYCRIAVHLGLYDSSTVLDLTDVETKYSVSSLKKEITEWDEQLSLEPENITLRFCQQVAHIYLNESVLHTPTNKMTFGIPFLPEKIMATDFARPSVISVEHVEALYALRDSCHNALTLARKMDVSTILALSSLCHIPRMLYSLFVLVKLHVALTAPGNTYGTVLDKTELRLDNHFQNMGSLATSLSAIDPTCYNTQIIGAYTSLEKWYHEYNAYIDQFKNDTPESTLGLGLSEEAGAAYRETFESEAFHSGAMWEESLLGKIDPQAWMTAWLPGFNAVQMNAF